MLFVPLYLQKVDECPASRCVSVVANDGRLEHLQGPRTARTRAEKLGKLSARKHLWRETKGEEKINK